MISDVGIEHCKLRKSKLSNKYKPMFKKKKNAFKKRLSNGLKCDT